MDTVIHMTESFYKAYHPDIVFSDEIDENARRVFSDLPEKIQRWKQISLLVSILAALILWPYLPLMPAHRLAAALIFILLCRSVLFRIRAKLYLDSLKNDASTKNAAALLKNTKPKRLKKRSEQLLKTMEQLEALKESDSEVYSVTTGSSFPAVQECIILIYDRETGFTRSIHVAVQIVSADRRNIKINLHTLTEHLPLPPLKTELPLPGHAKSTGGLSRKE